MADHSFDVVVVGAGNAAFCAALAAREQGASVLVLERAPQAERGGNSAFTAGNIRTVFNGVDDIKELIPDLTPDEIAITDFGTYTEDQFFDDMGRITEYRTNPDMCELLVKNSLPTMRWMKGNGIRFNPQWGNQAFKIEGRFKFWGGLVIQAWGGGPGLVDALNVAGEKAGIEVMYQARAMQLLHDDDGVKGVRVRQGRRTLDIAARAVVLCAGGFEANPEWRTRYLGPGWDLAKVRGSRFNTGDGIRMALDVGARAYGNWSGSHAVQWDQNAPEFGDLEVGDNFQKHSYPWSVMVNLRGKRFVDEGADFRNYTYAKYGGVVLGQPGQTAWQVFDSKVFDRLRAEYRIKQITKARSDTLEGLAAQMEGIDQQAFLAEIAAYNAAVQTGIPYNPNVKDGRRTVGLPVDKTNWANTIDTPPYEAYQVTCGITFTFGGLKIDNDGRVMDTEEMPIPGLYAAGELVGGLFYFNYPGGTGLMAGAVFGKIAGTTAGRQAVGNE